MIKCDVTGKEFPESEVFTCREPNVAKGFGDGETAHVNMFICKKCKYVVKYKYHGGISCGYSEDLP